jgi:methylglyoxal reductase
MCGAACHPRPSRAELEFSLRRLGTDYIDIYHTHWQADGCRDKYPIEATMECLLKLKVAGEDSGPSPPPTWNWTTSSSTRPPACAGRHPAQIQHAGPRRIESGLPAPLSAGGNISTLAYSPLEQGLLTGKIGMDATYDEGSFRNNIPWFQILSTAAGCWICWPAGADLTAKYGCSMAQLVIAWTLGPKQGVTFALCGARKEEHVRDNVAGGGACSWRRPTWPACAGMPKGLGAPQE